MYHKTGKWGEGSNSPLTLSAHRSICSFSQAYPESKTGWTERRRNSTHNCQKSWCPCFSSKTPWCMSSFTVCVLIWLHDIISLFLHQQLQHSRQCTNAKQRFILGQIPARGARASWVHHCRTHGSSARLCRETLCYLAYLSTISDGPAPNRSSS